MRQEHPTGATVHTQAVQIQNHRGADNISGSDNVGDNIRTRSEIILHMRYGIAYLLYDQCLRILQLDSGLHRRRGGLHSIE